MKNRLIRPLFTGQAEILKTVFATRCQKMPFSASKLMSKNSPCGTGRQGRKAVLQSPLFDPAGRKVAILFFTAPNSEIFNFVASVQLRMIQVENAHQKR